VSSTSEPLVSIVVFYREQAPLEQCLQSLDSQDGIERAEVILADGSVNGSATAVCDLFPRVHYLPLGPVNMPTGKAAAIRATRGEIIAILDPTDLAEPGWIREIIEGMASEQVTAVGGTVLPGDDESAGNVAAYLFEYGAFAPPCASGPTDGDLPGNNVAYRRSFLVEGAADLLEAGFFKPFFHKRIRERGGTLHTRSGMRVRHATRHRLGSFGQRCFHHGRCFGAMRRRAATSARRALYLSFAPVVPGLLAWRHVLRAVRHPMTRRLLPRALLALVTICACWGVGEWLGTWFGAGRSCREVY